jgi:hypothetical protein
MGMRMGLEGNGKKWDFWGGKVDGAIARGDRRIEKVSDDRRRWIENLGRWEEDLFYVRKKHELGRGKRGNSENKDGMDRWLSHWLFLKMNAVMANVINKG